MELFDYNCLGEIVKNCYFITNKYYNGNLRIDVFSNEEGPIATLTVNTERVLEEDCISIKDYSEGSNNLKFLQENEYVGEVLYIIDNGFVEIPVCKITDKFKKYISEN